MWDRGRNAVTSISPSWLSARGAQKKLPPAYPPFASVQSRMRPLVSTRSPSAVISHLLRIALINPVTTPVT